MQCHHIASLSSHQPRTRQCGASVAKKICMSIIKFVITGIKKDGLRHMSLNNDGRNTHDTKELAQKQLDEILTYSYNDSDTLNDLLGTDLKILPVPTYASGDATRTIFP